MVAKVQNVTAAERFWPNVDKTDTCWLWTGYIKPNGYASFYPGGGRHVDKIYAHRFSYESAKGAIPEGMQIDHTCNVRNCVNPDHLEVVTARENLDRAVERRTHCSNGHELASTARYVAGGYRRCRTCDRDAEARRRIVRGI